MDASESGTGRILREALRTREEDDATRVVSILEVIRKLKEQILEKDRIISASTGRLLAARDYLHRVLAALGDPVLVIDPEGAIEFANLAAQELLELPAQELLGRQAADLWASEEQRSLFRGERLRELFAGEATLRADLLLRTRRGEVPVAWTATVLREDEVSVGLVGIARDVRVQRRLEEDKLRTVQALAASVAHEIRNPLGAIRNSIGLLRRDLQLSGDDATLMDIVIEEAERISTIVSQFLDFARPPEPQFADGDLAGLVREVALLAEKDERAAGKAFLVHAEPDLPPLTFDPDQVKQVVWNLVSNALDAARERIAIRVRRGPGGVWVKVADDGAGMTPEVLARAAEPFRTTKAQGTGLGLAICKRIVEAHGGALHLESAPGATSVSFLLPEAPPPVADAGPAS
ncbi:MAG: nitrogen regulation protein NR(II) [Planctomycetota bacterium]